LKHAGAAREPGYHGRVPNLRPLLLLVTLCGCAAAPAPAAPPEPVRLAVLGPPTLGDPEADGEWTAEALLLEAVTWVSAEPDLDAVVLVGPLFAQAGPDATRALTGALGSVACPVVLAAAPGDLDPEGAVLEDLEREVPGHPGQAAYGRLVGGAARVAAAAPDGTGAGAAAPGEWSVRVEAGDPGTEPTHLVIRAGGALALTGPGEGAPARLEVPPLAAGLVTFVTLAPGGALSAEARSVTGGVAPPAPAPVRLAR